MRKINFLIAIDPTNTFCPGGELPVPNGDKIMPVINRLAMSGKFEKCILVTEQHPPGHISFASRYPGKKPFDRTTLENGQEIILWPDHSIQGTTQCVPHRDLNVMLFDARVVKGMNKEVESYSALCDYENTVVDGLLATIYRLAKELRVDPKAIELTFVGLALDYCAGLTAVDSVGLGFKTSLVINACRSVDPKTEVAMLKKLASLKVELTTSGQLLRPRRRKFGLALDDPRLRRGLQIGAV